MRHARANDDKSYMPTAHADVQVGFSAAELKVAGYSPTDMRHAGYTATAMREAAFTVKKLRAAG